MMPTRQVARIAISLPKPLLEALEKVRRISGDSRSGLVQKAIQRFLDERRRAARVRAYVDGYSSDPETPAELAAAEASGLALLAEEPWG